jgi:hypothetical protein
VLQSVSTGYDDSGLGPCPERTSDLVANFPEPACWEASRSVTHWVYGAEWDVMLSTVVWTLVLLGGGVVFAVVSLRGGVRTGARIPSTTSSSTSHRSSWC